MRKVFAKSAALLLCAALCAGCLGCTHSAQSSAAPTSSAAVSESSGSQAESAEKRTVSASGKTQFVLDLPTDSPNTVNVTARPAGDDAVMLYSYYYVDGKEMTATGKLTFSDGLYTEISGEESSENKTVTGGLFAKSADGSLVLTWTRESEYSAGDTVTYTLSAADGSEIRKLEFVKYGSDERNRSFECFVGNEKLIFTEYIYAESRREILIFDIKSGEKTVYKPDVWFRSVEYSERDGIVYLIYNGATMEYEPTDYTVYRFDLKTGEATKHFSLLDDIDTSLICFNAKQYSYAQKADDGSGAFKVVTKGIENDYTLIDETLYYKIKGLFYCGDRLVVKEIYSAQLVLWY